MKRSRGSSDFLSGFLPICHSSTDKQISPRQTTTFLYPGAGDFSTMFDTLDDDGSLEDIGVSSMSASEKKRRLSVDQVKALEKNFEIDNKLDPERKVKLAQELVLQPRQVAIWFQNRRARSKTKQLERDYGVLKSNFDALKRGRDSLQCDNNSLLAEIKELKAKLNVEKTNGDNGNALVEENGVLNANETEMTNNEVLDKSNSPLLPPHKPMEASTSELAYEMFSIFPRDEISFRENPTDSSDSSAVLNEEYSPTTAEPAAATAVEMSTMGCFGHFVKMEEHEDLFSGEEACKLFADNEQWYCSSQWNS